MFINSELVHLRKEAIFLSLWMTMNQVSMDVALALTSFHDVFMLIDAAMSFAVEHKNENVLPICLVPRHIAKAS